VSADGSRASVDAAKPQPATGHPQAVLRGCLLMCLAAGMFPFINASAKLLTAEYAVPQVVWARFAGHLAVVLIAFLPGRGLRLLRPRRPAIQIGRGALLVGSTLFFISGIGGVPLATASAILFTTPVAVAALSGPLLGERVGGKTWAAILVGFAGVLVIIRPGAAPVSLPVLCMLGAAACYAVYQIVTRRTRDLDSPETGIVYVALVGTAVTSLAVPFFFETPRSLLDLGLFCAMGFFGGFGHYILMRAFQLAPASLLSPLGYTELITATILGWLIFHTIPDALTWLGAAIIIGSGIVVASQGRRH
jgi:drug/metabolite transporter (DMT)-like permease